jgi:hypothetical protein
MVVMAKQVIMTDDLDGSTEAETVDFSLLGTAYEIDLSSRNRKNLEKALRPYIDVARKTTGRGGRGGGRRRQGRRSSASDLSAVREWAMANGHEISARGRIPAHVREAYDAAH